MMNRNWAKYENGVETDSGQHTITWEELRAARDCELRATDHWALSDREMSDDQRDYRAMLRDLPSDFPGDDANEACDHWVSNPRPEE